MRLPIRNPQSAIRNRWLALLILPLTFATYLPATFGDFIWDDDDYVTANETLRSASGLQQIWFDVKATPQYYPLVHTTYWIEYHLWQLNPHGYHVSNILLHGMNAVLLCLLLWHLQVPGAWLAAAIFALHPVHVESVAWITERKNVLSGFFYLASALCYLQAALPPLSRYSGRGAGGEGSEPSNPPRSRFALQSLSLVLFICAMLSKTTAATLPAALLLVLWWKRGRIVWRDVLPLLPMFAVGIGLGLLTVWLEKEHVGAKGADWDLSSVDRCLIAGRAVWFYMGKLLWPTHLAFIYPRWQIDASVWWQYLFPVAALAVIVILWCFRRTLGTGPLVAVLFFGGTLLPALGFFDIYPMVYSFVANHFQYLASIGPITLFAALAVAAARRWHIAEWLRVCLGLALLSVLGILTWTNCLSYLNPDTLWHDTLAINPECWMAHNNLGVLHEKRGEGLLMVNQPEAAYLNFHTALQHYLRAIEIYPRDADVWHNLGIIHVRQQKYKEAAEYFAEAVRLNPRLRSVENLGLAYYLDNKYDKALTTFEQALAMEPTRAATHKSLGMVLAKQGKRQAAIDHLEEALRLDPSYGEARGLLQQIRKEEKASRERKRPE